MPKQYSDKQKAAYYKKKSSNGAKPKRKSASGNKYLGNFNKPYKYPGLGRKIGGAIGGYGGNMIAPGIGGVAGNLIGQAVGQGAHALMKTVTGYGDYTVSKNSLVYNYDAVPQFTNNARCTIVTHREFIKDIRGSVSFDSFTTDINPANPTCFPWLSSIAENYEEYVIQGLLFEFKTTCAMAVSSTNTAMGTVILATQYNSLSAAFSNKQQMENYEFAQSSVPSMSVVHPVECDPQLTANQGLFYVNSGINAAGDPRLYNIGKFTIATQGMQAIATIGELWVTYKICLLKPKLVGSCNLTDNWELDMATASTLLPFGSEPVLVENSSSLEDAGNLESRFTSLITSPWTGASNNFTCYINPGFTGQLLIVFQTHGATAGFPLIDWTATVAGNVVYLSDPSNPQVFASYQKYYSTAPAIGYDNTMQSYMLKCNGGYASGGIAPSITFAAGNSVGTFGNLVIYAVPSILV